MNSEYISAELRRQVIRRSESRCEYCLLSVNDSFFEHEADHIIAKKHGGETSLENLALACFDCNRFKGSDIASLDPRSGELVPLFNPRTDEWQIHFSVDGGTVAYQAIDILF